MLLINRLHGAVHRCTAPEVTNNRLRHLGVCAYSRSCVNLLPKPAVGMFVIVLVSIVVKRGTGRDTAFHRPPPIYVVMRGELFGVHCAIKEFLLPRIQSHFE